jgi:hypothetical protein
MGQLFLSLTALGLLFWAQLAAATIHILESESVHQPEHAELVQWVACPEETAFCEIFISDFEATSLLSFANELNSGDVVNMSFGYQRIDDSAITRNHYQALQAQGMSVEDYKNKFDERERLMRQMMTENPEVLFVAAAGNGAPLTSMLGSVGQPLGPQFKIYPAFFEYDNLIKVTSINASNLDIKSEIPFEIPDYANYSSDFVDVAAPVEIDVNGTSFAAPYVARLAKEIQSLVSAPLSRADLKSVFLKSCFIPDIDHTLNTFQTYQQDHRGSVLGQIQNMFLPFRDRKALIDDLHERPLILVKCGGVISSEVAKSCARTFAEGSKSIRQSCLEAQIDAFALSEGHQEKLTEFWDVQGL